MSRTFDSLRFRNYRLWFYGALVANIGTWMQRIAQSWLVLTVLTADSGAAVGIVIALQFAPILFATPYGGLLADRLDRRRLLVMTQVASALLAAALGVLVLADLAVLWHVYAFAFLLGIVAAIDSPVRQTFVADLVPLESLANAVGLNGANFNAARLIGPAAAGVLIAAVGPGWVFIVNGLSYLAPIVMLLLMRSAELHAVPTVPKGRGQLRDGVAYVRGRTDILVIMGIMAVVGALGLNFQITSAVMAREVFARGAGEYGVLGSIMAIGSLSGALLAARRSRPRVRLVITAAFLFGVASLVSALLPTFWTYALSGILVGFFATTLMNSANAAIQLSTEAAMRGRVMALYMMVFLGTTPIGSPLVGWVAEAFGARWSVALGGIASILVALAAAVWAWRSWDVSVDYGLRPRPRLTVYGPAERLAAPLVSPAPVRPAASGQRAHRQSRSTSQSTEAVRARTSSGSTAGKTPTRIWLRPSLRYGSTSTTPLSRRWAIRVAASTPSRSRVATTGERCSGSCTKGVANEDASAQP